MQPVTLFLRVFAWFTLRQLTAHPWRLLTVLLGIVLGAAVFTSVRLSIHASVSTFERSVDLLAGRSDLSAVRPGERLSESILAPLLRHPAVRRVSPFCSTYVQSPGRTAESFRLLGVAPLLDRAFRPWAVAPGRVGTPFSWQTLIRRPNTMLVTAVLAGRHGWRSGDQVTLVHSSGRQRFTIAAVVDDPRLNRVEGGWVAVTDIASFQEFTDTRGLLDRIDLQLADSDASAARRQLAQLLPPGVVLADPSAGRRGGRYLIRAYRLNLSILSIAALLVGMFLVYSLVALNAASRRREVAILRACGGSSKLVFALFLVEGAVLGAAGWALALPVSIVLVKQLITGIGQTISDLFVRVRVDDLVLSPSEVGLSLAATVGVAVLAALVPARRAMAVRPAEVMAAAREPSSRSGRRLRFLLGLGLLMLAWPVSRLPGPDDLPLPGYAAVLMLFVAIALASSWGLSCAGGTLSPLLTRWFGTPARLAGKYLRHGGAETAVAVTALITAVALFTALAIMVHSFRQTVTSWVSQAISGDLFVRPPLAVANEFKDPLPAATVVALKRLSPPAELMPSRQFQLTHDGRPYQFEALDMAAFFKRADFVWMSPPTQRLRHQVAAGEGVLVSEVFANRSGLRPGDRFHLRLRGRHLALPVAGQVRDYRTRGGVVFYDLAALERRLGPVGWGAVRIYRQSPHDPMAETLGRWRRALTAGSAKAPVEMISGSDLRRAILRIFDETFALTWILLLVSLAVAALGVATTMTIRVLERSRDISTLVAIGADRRQVGRMVMCEAILLSVVGIIAGLGAGYGLSLLLIYVINRQSFGWTFIYQVDWSVLAVMAPLVLLSAMVAALPAVRLAVARPPSEALRER
jgi:putative ABC transport system permease protein